MSGPFYVLYRVKNEEAFIEKSIKSVQEFADKIIVFDDHSTDKTVDIALAQPKTVVIKSPFDQTVDEIRDKKFLIDEALKGNPEWCLGLDADEQLVPDGARRLRGLANKLSREPNHFYQIYFQFLYVWDTVRMDVRWDGVYQSFIMPRMWNVPKDLKQVNFKSRGHGGGFHCGWVPDELSESQKLRTKVCVLHYGNWTKELRRKKYVWYNLTDPMCWNEDRYQHIYGAGKYFKFAGEEVELVPATAFVD